MLALEGELKKRDEDHNREIRHPPAPARCAEWHPRGSNPVRGLGNPHAGCRKTVVRWLCLCMRDGEKESSIFSMFVVSCSSSSGHQRLFSEFHPPAATVPGQQPRLHPATSCCSFFSAYFAAGHEKFQVLHESSSHFPAFLPRQRLQSVAPSPSITWLGSGAVVSYELRLFLSPEMLVLPLWAWFEVGFTRGCYNFTSLLWCNGESFLVLLRPCLHLDRCRRVGMAHPRSRPLPTPVPQCKPLRRGDAPAPGWGDAQRG